MVKKAVKLTSDPTTDMDMERLYFIVAIAVILLSGDLVWWEAKTANDYLTENEAAAIYTIVSDPDKRELIELTHELEAAQEELEQFVQQNEAVPQ